MALPDGTSFTLLCDDADLVEFEITLVPGGLAPPPHLHPEQEEEWEVLAGRPSVFVDDAWRELAPGDSLVIPPGVVHTIRNRSQEPARVLDRHRPPVGFAAYIEALGRAGRAGSLRNASGALRLAVVADSHRRMQQPASRRLRAAIAVGALIGRRLVGSPESWPPGRDADAR